MPNRNAFFLYFLLLNKQPASRHIITRLRGIARIYTVLDKMKNIVLIGIIGNINNNPVKAIPDNQVTFPAGLTWSFPDSKIFYQEGGYT